MLLLVLLGEGEQLLYALLDGSSLGDFVKGFVLLFDVMLVFVIHVYVRALHIGKTCTG